MLVKLVDFLQIGYNTSENIYSDWRCVMDFIKPKNTNKENVCYNIIQLRRDNIP